MRSGGASSISGSRFVWLPIVSLCAFGLVPLRAWADAISPAIGQSSVSYSSEKPNTAYYGTGVSGRLNEASALRFQGEQDTQDGLFDSAIRKLAKAIQLDPGDPTGHLFYARALSRKINSGKIDPKEVAMALYEWKLLWHHDADQNEQLEAHLEARRIGRIAKALDKRLKSRQQSQIAEKTSPETR